MKKSFLVVFLFFLFFNINCFCQEENQNHKESQIFEENRTPEENSEIQKSKITFEWALSFSPTLIINSEDTTHGAVSPFVYPFCISLIFPAKKFVTFQPSLSIFTNYWLYYDDYAYPAEIENRTALGFSFLLNLPCVVQFELGKTKNHLIETGGGLSFLARFGVLANGVDSDDFGYTGKAGDDVKEINKWFWSSANFLYLNVGFDYLYKFSEKIKAGPEFKFYLPMGSIFSGHGLNNAMLSFGVKARF